MIKVETFIERLNANKCIKSNYVLENNEYLVSKKSFPYLYEKEFDKAEKEYIKVILSFLHKNNNEIINIEKENLIKLQKFYNLIMEISEEYINERGIHLYIFLFWENLIWDQNIKKGIKRENFFYEGQVINNEDKFQKNLLPHISNNCDLIYYNDVDNAIELIEIKNVDLDDRAISQIQRYYRATNLVCETYEHNLKILNLKPTLIIKRDDGLVSKKSKTPLIQYWLTFPTYFREILQIYSFSYCRANETLKITDLKPKLKSLVKEQQIQ